MFTSEPKELTNLSRAFLEPANSTHRQYEALRAFFVDHLSGPEVARHFGVSPGTVNRWVRHAQGQRLDRVDWSDRSRVPYTTQRTEASIENLVLEVRHQLQVESDLSFHGAEAILQALRGYHVDPL